MNWFSCSRPGSASVRLLLLSSASPLSWLCDLATKQLKQVKKARQCGTMLQLWRGGCKCSEVRWAPSGLAAISNRRTDGRTEGQSNLERKYNIVIIIRCAVDFQQDNQWRSPVPRKEEKILAIYWKKKHNMEHPVPTLFDMNFC